MLKINGTPSALSVRGDARNDLRFAAGSGAWQLDAGDRHAADPLIPYLRVHLWNGCLRGRLATAFVAWPAASSTAGLFLGREVPQGAGANALAYWTNAGTVGSAILGAAPTSVTLSDEGTWGYTGNDFWAVVQLDASHPDNNVFAVIPEPTSLSLLGLGLLGRRCKSRR